MLLITMHVQPRLSTGLGKDSAIHLQQALRAITIGAANKHHLRKMATVGLGMIRRVAPKPDLDTSLLTLLEPRQQRAFPLRVAPVWARKRRCLPSPRRLHHLGQSVLHLLLHEELVLRGQRLLLLRWPLLHPGQSVLRLLLLR